MIIRRRVIWFIIAGLVLMTALTGCGNGTDNTDNTDKTDNQQGMPNQGGVSSQGWDNSRNNNFPQAHSNSRMEISNDIAENISAMDEVDSATVLITDRNAYVAVLLDNGRGYGASSMRRNVGKVNTPNQGVQRSSNATGGNGTTDFMGRQGPGPGADGITDQLKSEIAQKVRAIQPQVEQVYVSANPDFVGRMRGYGERFQNGQPLQGLIIEFNTLVQRLFPTAE